MDQAVYYAQLEQGARYLAACAANLTERQQHLAWANRYYRLSTHAREVRSEQIKVAA